MLYYNMGTVEGPALPRRLHRAPAGAPRHPAEPKIRICHIISYHIISYDRAAAGAPRHPARTGRARELGTCVVRARAYCGGEERKPPPVPASVSFSSLLYCSVPVPASVSFPGRPAVAPSLRLSPPTPPPRPSPPAALSSALYLSVRINCISLYYIILYLNM